MSSISKKGKAGGANLALALAMTGKRSSNAAGPHADKRQKRTRTRAARRAAILRDFA